MMQEFVKWFEDLTIGDVPSVGGKILARKEFECPLGLQSLPMHINI